MQHNDICPTSNKKDVTITKRRILQNAVATELLPLGDDLLNTTTVDVATLDEFLDETVMFDASLQPLGFLLLLLLVDDDVVVGYEKKFGGLLRGVKERRRTSIIYGRHFLAVTLPPIYMPYMLENPYLTNEIESGKRLIFLLSMPCVSKIGNEHTVVKCGRQ
ncbi:MAG: hypothetical protein ACKPB4_22855 [Sphaerospermopsis kisseleviana]